MAELEKIYTVNLSKAYDKVREKRTKGAIGLLRNFIIKNTKTLDAKLSSLVNNKVWACGIQKPPRNLKVRVIVDEGIAKVYLPEEKIEKKDDKKADKKQVEAKKTEDKPTVKEAEKTSEKNNEKPAKKGETKKEDK